MSLSFQSVATLSAALKVAVHDHHFLLDTLPSAGLSMQAAYADGLTGSGAAASEMIHDLGGLAAAW